MHFMRRFIAGLCLCLMASAATAQSVTLVPDLSRLRIVADVDVVALTREHYPETLSLLEREFPDDYAALLHALGQIEVGRDSKEAALVRAFGELTDLRRKYAERLRFAPRRSHAAMLGHLAAFYNLVFEAEGPAICGRFAQDGSAVLFEVGLSERYAEQLDQQSVRFFEAVVGAIEAPEPSEPVMPADWEVVLEHMVAAGAPPVFVATIGGGDPADPNLCPALAAMMVTSSVLDTAEGARIRADFARNLVGY